jgi:hypothetical protein
VSGVNPITRSAAWIRASSLRAKTRDLPRPTDAPQTHAEGVAADRILLLGSGVAVGWGATGWDDALAGELARAVAARTGRGVDVDVVADPDMTVHNAPAHVEGMKLWRYQAIVVALGFNESIDLVFPEVWSGQLDALLATLRTSGAAVVTLGNPPSASLPHLSERFSTTVDAHAALLDAASAAVAPHFVPLAAEGWADAIADAVVPLLGPPDERGYDSEDDRLATVASLAAVEWGANARMDEVLALAKDLFGTEAALFTVIDRDVERHPAYLGGTPDSVPRTGSFCSVTIQQRGALVVGDATKDPRFKAYAPVLDDPHLRFYAGFPIEAPNGEPLGALCVYDSTPRDADTVDQATLRRLALLLQAEVHRAMP